MAIGVFLDVSGVFGRADWAAVAEEDQVFANFFGGDDDALGAGDSVVHGDRSAFDADGAADGCADVRDDDVGAGFGHGGGFVGFGNVNDAEEIHFAGNADHLDFEFETHAGFFEDFAEVAVDDAVGGEVVYAAEAHIFDLKEPVPHATAGIAAMHAADNGSFFDDGQDFVFADFHGDGVGIAVSHEAGGGSASSHAETAGVVNDDEVSAAFFDEFGGDACAGAGGDDGLALLEGGAEAIDNFFAGVGISFSGPGIRHIRFGC